MIPRAAILHGPESVVEAVARCNWTLSDAIDTVHMHGKPLSNAMPVDTGAIILHFVVDDNCNVLKDH
jgi:hypothetical protein